MTAATEAPEEWEPIPGHHPYEASTDGRVRNGRTLRVLACRSNGQKGYRKIWLGRSRDDYVHVLVLEAFIGPRPPEHEAHHRDFNPTNNSLGNLVWIPSWQNQLIRRNGPPPPPGWLGHTGDQPLGVSRNNRRRT